MEARRGSFRGVGRTRKGDYEVSHVDGPRARGNSKERYVFDDMSDDERDMEDDDSDQEMYIVEEKARRNEIFRRKVPGERVGGAKVTRRDYEDDYVDERRHGPDRRLRAARYVERRRPYRGIREDREPELRTHKYCQAVDRHGCGGSSYGIRCDPPSESYDEDLIDVVEENQTTPGGITYLSNVQSVVRTIRSLPFTEEHIEKLKKTPFWWFINAVLEMDDPAVFKQFRKKNFLITRIVKRFQRKGRRLGFKFGEVFLVPKRDDFVLVFGVNCGGREIHVGGGSVLVTGFLQRCFPRKIEHMAASEKTHYKMTPTLIFDTLSEKVRSGQPGLGEDIGRLMHLFLLASFFLPNHGLTLPWRLTETVDKFEELCEYDWCTFVLESLMEDINNHRNFKIGACSIFLLFWLCERTSIIKPVRGCKTFPRFLKWDLFAMGTATEKMDFDHLFQYTDLIRKLVPTNEEYELLNLDDAITEEEIGDSPEQYAESDNMFRKDKGKAKVSDVPTKRERFMPEVRNHGKSVSFNSKSDGTTSFEDIMMDVPDQPPFDLMDDLDDNERNVSRNVRELNRGKQKVQWSNPVVKEVRHSAVEGGRILFPDEKDEQLKLIEIKLKGVESELAVARATIATLKTEIDIKESATIAYADEINSEEIEALKKKLAETELMRSRLSAFRHEDARKIEKLAKERWQFSHDLERERVSSLAIKEENTRLAKVEEESSHRTFQLITENDRLSAELATALKFIADAGLIYDVTKLSVGDRVMSTTPYLAEKERSRSVDMHNNSEQSKNSQGIQPSVSGGVPVGSFTMNQSPAESGNHSRSHSLNTICAANSKAVSSGSGDIRSVGSTLGTPMVQQSQSGTEAESGSEIQGAESVEKPNSMVLRVQERTKLNARKKTELGTPIPMSLTGETSTVDISDEIRPFQMDREGVAFRCSLPHVISWIERKFMENLPSTSILQLQNSQMANYITLFNLEAILNNGPISDAVLDIWGLLISQKVAAENTARANRVFVARQIYLFHSFC